MNRKYIWVAFVSTLGMQVGACTQAAVTPSKEASSPVQPGSNEKVVAPSSGYVVDGDVVHVNNRLCAMSGSPLAEADLTKFQSRVTYDGPIEKFKGKTMVFNQCCNMCIGTFPKKWAEERDAIMLEHGLASAAH